MVPRKSACPSSVTGCFSRRAGNIVLHLPCARLGLHRVYPHRVQHNLSRRAIMKSKRNKFVYLAAGFALPLLWTAGISDASARPPRGGSATVTRTGPAGNMVSRTTNVSTTGAGGFNSRSTVTGPAGNSATRVQSGSYNAATNTWNRSATTTGPAGNQSSVNATVQGTGNGYQRNVTRTGPNGQTVTTQGQASYNPATGTLNQSRTVTGPNGKSATESRTVNVGTAPSN